MKGLKRTTPSSYDVGDYVAIVEDSHIFVAGDLSNGRESESLGNITTEEVSKLLMQDTVALNSSAISKLPTFRSSSTGRLGLSVIHRRKYYFENGSVKLKSNAQSVE